MMTVSDSMTLLSSRFLADASTWPLHDLVYRGKGAASYSAASDEAFMFILYQSIIWFVVLMGLMVFFVFKYRRREGRPAPVSPSHSTKIELAWTIFPSLLLVVMFIMGFKGYRDMVVPKGGGLDVDLIGQKWSWTMTYANGAGSTHLTKPGVLASKPVPVYYVPEGTPIRLKMISKDVMHSFYVPDFRTKFDVLPNRYTKFWFETEMVSASPNARTLSDIEVPEPGFAHLKGTPYVDHWVFCAEYCGDFHSEMAAVIRVLPKDKFEWWFANADKALPPAQQGQKIYENNCAACHSIDGSGRTGPTWKNLYGKTETLSGGKQVKVDDDYLRESIWYPTAKVVAGFEGIQMTSFLGVLDDPKINALIAFMKSEWCAENWKELGGVSKDWKSAAEADGAKPGEKAADKPADKPADPAADKK